MDALKRQRKVQRALLTKASNNFWTEWQGEGSKDDKILAFQLLENKMAELETIHEACNKDLFSKEMDEEEIEKEMEINDAYKKLVLVARLKVAELSVPVPQQLQQQPHLASTPVTVHNTLKLPKIELPKFNGHIKEWLPFWSQFNKIHNDQSINREDKFQYLLQAVVPGTRAGDLVSSFPSTAENYDKAIKCLKNRFGRDDIIVEFYVRELLGLVLQNAVKKEKPLLSSIYDKLELYIRALETLGVTTDKCAAMLYPLVESSLPEEILRAWQRSGVRENSAAGGQEEQKDRLRRLLEFLQLEVENEERIEMALAGFGTSSDQQERARKLKGKVESNRDIPTASTLLAAKSNEKPLICIFCHSSHDSRDCETARKLNLEERREVVKKENCCFYCLKKGHIARLCKVRIKCDWCGRRHVLLMCPNIVSQNSDEIKSNGKAIDVKILAAIGALPSVCLQTLRVTLYSGTKKRIVRVLIDTGSQRSYVRSSIANELGFVSIGKQEIIHSLFGGVKSQSEVHDIFVIHLKSLNDSYACNFSVLNKDVICDTIPGLNNVELIKCLRDRNICLTDVQSEQDTIDILIGADVAGKLFTGKKIEVENGQ